MRHCAWFTLPSPHVENGANSNLLTTTIDLIIVAGASTACDRVAKDRVWSVDSSSSVKRPSLQELAFSLQVLLPKANIVCLGLREGIDGAEASKRQLDNSYQNALQTLERALELHSKLKQEN
ncbi:hypothetical protein J1N35_022647 [Gossypium stocksii]|uniref:Uncharacterized protein n=1 Tax=Gossypium stocksii TaxID=47602 RepID=A0A9D3VH52_9ROSI|nr:hypothetical protein J1N35_022647 [Gossypium stocksii]